MNPLVSIVTRTLGRPCLADAAASVQAQTYRPLEWVVVDAAGTGVDVPSAGDVPVRVVGAGRRLLRSPAGNLGFRAAAGRYLLVLDDDDLLHPEHVAGLVAAIAAQPGIRAAYADAEVRTGVGTIGGEYAREYSRLALCRSNLFPPLAVLFDAELVRTEGCRYDEALDFYDDWDLWLQMSAYTDFAHVRRHTAIYCAHLSQSGVLLTGTPDVPPRSLADEATVRARCAATRATLEALLDRHKDEAGAASAAGSLDEAAAAWLRAHAVDPYDPGVLLGYAGVAFRARDLPTALAALDRALQLAPNAGLVHWNRAVVLAALGRAAEAAAARECARALDPTPDPRR